MATLTLYPDRGLDLAEAFARLGRRSGFGRSALDTLVLTPGAYGADQGIHHVRGPAAPEGTRFTIRMSEGAVVDFGARSWTDIYVPRGKDYRQFRLGRGYLFEGPGTIRNGGASLFHSDGDLTLDGLTLRSPFGLGIQETGQSDGGIRLLGCTIEDVGIDPEAEDPVWRIVGRVPRGVELTGGGLTYDVHEAVARAGLTGRIVRAARPDIAHARAFAQERTLMYFLCKHLGYKGDGFAVLYAQSRAGHPTSGYEVRGCRIERVSGPVFFLNGRHDGTLSGVRIEDNDVRGALALYTTWHNVRDVQVRRNRVRIEVRDNGPRRAFGFVANNDVAAVHTNNEWTYLQGRGVYAYRAWHDSPLPVGSGDVAYSSDGRPVPVYGGGQMPAEPIPGAALPVVPVGPDLAGLETLKAYRETPVVARFLPGVYRRAVALAGYVHLTIEAEGAVFTGIDATRRAGRAAFAVERCARVRIRDLTCEMNGGAGLACREIGNLVVERYVGRLGGWNGWSVQACPGARLVDCVLASNNLMGPADDGGNPVRQSPGAALERCTFRGNRGPGLSIGERTDDARLTACVFEDNTGAGLRVETSARVTAEACRSASNAAAPLELRDAPDFASADSAWEGPLS